MKNVIQVVPLKDLGRRQELLKSAGAVSPTAEILSMTDGNREAGWAAVELDRKTLRILKLTAEGWDGTEKPDSEQVFTLDTLMRSAASYGEVFGAERIETAFPDFFDFFRLRGFETDGTRAFTPMGTIVHYQ